MQPWQKAFKECAVMLALSTALFLGTVAQSATNQPQKILLTQTIGTNKCYIGQAIPLTISWSSLPAIGRFKAVDIRVPTMETNSFKIFKSHKSIDAPTATSLGIPLSGTRAIAQLSQTRQHNQNYTTLQTKIIVTPMHPGKQVLYPATITCALCDTDGETMPHHGCPKGSGNLYQYPLYFNNSFFDLDVPLNAQHLKAQSNPIILTVKSLPPAPSPLFTGLVGQYTFQITPSSTNIRIGDPLQITLTVSSETDYLEPVILPPLQDYPSFTNRFRVVNDRRMSRIDTRSISFTQTIYPRKKNSEQTFPALSLIYFNPHAHKYETANSKPWKFQIKKTKLIDSHIFGTKEERAQQKQPKVWLLIMVLIAVAALSAYLRYKYPCQTCSIKNTPADPYCQFKNEISHIATQPDASPQKQYRDLNKALTGFFSHKLTHHTPESITWSDIRELLEETKTDETTIHAIATLFKTINHQRFASHPTNSNIKQDIQTAIEQIDSL